MATETMMLRGTEVEICQCGKCGVTYVVSKFVRDQQRKSGGFSCCPNGHQWGWDKDNSEDARIRRERDQLAQQIAQKDDAIRAEREAREAAERRRTRLRQDAGEDVPRCPDRMNTTETNHA